MVSGLSQGAYTIIATDLTVNITNTLVTQIIQPNALGVNIAASSPTACVGSNITFTALASSGIPGYTYSWTGGPTTATRSVSPLLAGNYVYNITATDANSCTASQSISVNVISNPTLTVLSTSICPLQTATLSVSGANTYTWIPTSTLGTTFTVSPLTTSVYTIFGAANGCIANATVELVVNPTPTLIASASTVCANQTLSLYAASFSGANYAWSSMGGFISNLQNPVIANASSFQSGSYIVTVTSAQGCTNSAVVNALVVPPPFPIATLTGNGTLCAQALNGSLNTITLTSSGANTYTLTTPVYISNNNPSGPISPLFTIPPFQNIVALATATLEGSNGICTASTSVNFTILPNPIVTINAYTPTICAGQSFTYTSNGANSYTWISSNSGLSNYTNAITVANPTVSSIFSVLGSSLGCNSSSETSSLTVNALPLLNFSALPSTSICAGSSLILSGLGASTYTWSSGVTNGVSFIPSSTTTYSLTGTDLNGCSNMHTVAISLNAQPSILTEPLSQTLATGSSTQFIVSSSNASSTFQWQQDIGSGFVNLMNSLQFSGVTTPTLTVSNASLVQNNTKFRCVVSDGNCSDTSAIANLSVYDHTAIKKQVVETYFKLWPNPTENSVTIQVSDLFIGKLYQIIDQTGRLVLIGIIEKTNTELDISFLAGGLYFVCVNNSYQKPIKLIKE